MRRDDSVHIGVGIGLFALGFASVVGLVIAIYSRATPDWATAGLSPV
jgi:hypothetical protein